MQSRRGFSFLRVQHLLHPLRVWIDFSHWFALWFDMHVLKVIRKTNKNKATLATENTAAVQSSQSEHCQCHQAVHVDGGVKDFPDDRNGSIYIIFVCDCLWFVVHVLLWEKIKRKHLASKSCMSEPIHFIAAHKHFSSLYTVVSTLMFTYLKQSVSKVGLCKKENKCSAAAY